MLSYMEPKRPMKTLFLGIYFGSSISVTLKQSSEPRFNEALALRIKETIWNFENIVMYNFLIE